MLFFIKKPKGEKPAQGRINRENIAAQEKINQDNIKFQTEANKLNLAFAKIGRAHV